MLGHPWPPPHHPGQKSHSTGQRVACLAGINPPPHMSLFLIPLDFFGGWAHGVVVVVLLHLVFNFFVVLRRSSVSTLFSSLPSPTHFSLNPVRPAHAS